MHPTPESHGYSFDPNGVEERLNALWKVVTELVEQFNIYRGRIKRSEARWGRLENEMLEAVSEVHGRIDKLIGMQQHDDGDDGPQDTDNKSEMGFLDTMD